MALALSDIRNQEREALLGEYVFPEGVGGHVQVSPYSAIPDVQTLQTTPSAIRTAHPVSIQPYPDQDPARGFVQLCPSLRYKFLWLSPSEDNYLSIYRAFLRRYHGVEPTTTGYDVDHLFSRARAVDLNLSFVRMILLGPGENRSHGGGYESGRTRSGIGAPGRPRGIDEVMLMKLCGIRSPRKNRPLTAEMLFHIQRIAGLFGLSPLEIERNIRELMEVAAFRPGEA